MSLEQLKAFISKVRGDSNHQERLKAAKSPEDVIDITKEHGHEFTADKIIQLSKKVLETCLEVWILPSLTRHAMRTQSLCSDRDFLLLQQPD
ncbi:Nif11-like leader peptide family natural product precursor [Synechococcus sp. NOUM97013]|uniref:Nif11-like leader peptide family natural product precursor n=1 Tax=Synechococcus sp. NOUM97013 TaxID=1442555 RepID=UPI0016488CF3|nr:Nif11-like leader peptide family natural product precursor [Synechococcus sp. NOUM97013]